MSCTKGKNFTCLNQMSSIVGGNLCNFCSLTKKGDLPFSPTRTQPRPAEAKLALVGVVVKGHSQDRGFFLAADLLLMLISLRKVQIILNFKGEFREEAIKFVGKRSNGKVNCMLLSALHSLVPPHLSL